MVNSSSRYRFNFAIFDYDVSALCFHRNCLVWMSIMILMEKVIFRVRPYQ